jgi:hypothetical protein
MTGETNQQHQARRQRECKQMQEFLDKGEKKNCTKYSKGDSN